jgi:hypothetical protein
MAKKSIKTEKIFSTRIDEKHRFLLITLKKDIYNPALDYTIPKGTKLSTYYYYHASVYSTHTAAVCPICDNEVCVGGVWCGRGTSSCIYDSNFEGEYTDEEDEDPSGETIELLAETIVARLNSIFMRDNYGIFKPGAPK